MKILVPTKRVPDTDQKVKLRADGKGVDSANLPTIINPFDAIALEEALRIRERSSGAAVEVIAAAIGAVEWEKELRAALAMGADRAILVEAPAPLDPWNVARVLAALAAREKPDLVLMGKQAVDDDSNQAGQFLAALLSWPQATFASKIDFAAGFAEVCRETDQGLERVRVKLPAVITVDLRLNEPRYASLPNIMKAKKKPIDALKLAALDVRFEPKLELVAVAAPQARRSCKRVASVDELIAKLREEAKVI
jgi:electron transfer flavoprotein beta subunit